MLLKTAWTLLRYFCFWLIFFFLERLVFVVYNIQRLSKQSLPEIAPAFLYGLWMDISMAGYICAIPLVVFLVLWYVPKVRISNVILSIYTWILIVVCALLTVVNFNIYREWGTKVNYRTFELAINSPKEAMASSGSSPLLLSFGILLALSALGIYLSRKVIRYQIDKSGNVFGKIGLTLAFIGLTILAIRGGLQDAPMNESMAYYSTNSTLNYAAVNTEWGLATDIKNSKYNTKNPYLYFKPAEAKSIVASFYEQPDSTAQSILTTKRPNVVIIIMESHTGNVVESLGGEPGISNNIERLKSEGVFFDQIYASGGRTDKGVVAVLSAFPAQASRSIMKENSKQSRIPALSQTFGANGYVTPFFYGGESRFANMKSYLLSHNVNQIIEKSSFEAKYLNSNWGAFDGPVYQRMTAELDRAQLPFFATMLTLTNHEPFGLPVARHFKGESTEDKFRSTAYYADSCLGAFIDQAKVKPWYKNTLFVVVADHGHFLPRTDLEVFDPRRYRIPLLFFGPAVKPEFKGKVIHQIGGQTDIAATLLNQLGMDTKPFKWSKDLLNSTSKQFAFFNWDHGFGFVTPHTTVAFDAVGKQLLLDKPAAVSDTNQHRSGEVTQQALNGGKAFMQEVYQQYMSY
jgi:phosphoglycerol transferase MdoB-like AlkP superfamily enzyme